MMEELSPLVGTTKPLTLTQKIGYGLGHMQNDLSASMWFSYALGYFKLVTSSDLLSGILIMIGQLFDAIATPVAGYFLDGTHKKKMWHLSGCLAVGLSFPFVFAICTVCYDSNIWEGLYYGIVVVIFQVGWAVVQISHLSILPQIAQNPKEKSDLAAFRYAASMISNVILYTIALWTFYGTATGETTLLTADDDHRFFEIGLSVTGIGIFTSTMFHLIIKRKKPSAPQQLDGNQGGRFHRFRAYHNIFLVSVIHTSSRLFINATIEYMILYLNETVVSNKEIVATIPLTMFVLSAVTSIFFKKVIRINNQKITFLIGGIICITGCCTLYMRNGRSDHVEDLFIAAALLGTGSALTLVVSLSFAANLVTTEGTEGFIFSTVTFADKAVNGLAVLIIEYMKCSEPQLCEFYYKNVMVFFNGGVITIGMLFVCFVSPKLTALDQPAPCHRSKDDVCSYRDTTTC